MTERRRRVRTLLAATVACSVLALGGCGDDAKGTSVAEVPFSAPDGATASVGDFAGSPLVVNMWATNCKPCVKEMPAIDEVATELDGSVQIIGVNVFDTPENAASFAADLGVAYPQFTDPDGRLSTALSVTGLPATAFFSADGTLLDVHQGAYTADELRAAIEQQFAAGSTPTPDSPAPEGTTP
ncbi:MAG: TlpA disulfide reductase family protein [Ilumatobacteraceae bacterium]